MKHAFSLVELSIVLVILGLLTGGVVTGQSLIRAAEMRSVVTELSEYQKAVKIFQDQYGELPGDMSDAEDHWGTAHATDATCITTIGTGTETCNGDGDGNIGVAAPSTRSNEKFRFWQHLANAGLIEGEYTGVEGSSGNTSHAVIGTNVPASSVKNAGWSTTYGGTSSGTAVLFAGEYDHFFRIGAETSTSMTKDPVFTVKEVWKLDQKLDDGLPGVGTVIGFPLTDCTDAASNGNSNDDELNASYSLKESGKICSIIFSRAF